MTHDNKKCFAKKHTNIKIDEKLAQLIQAKAIDQRIACSTAHEIAKAAGTSPIEIGRQIDLMEYRLIKCQLGLFGYKNKKKLNPDIDISPQLTKKIDAAATDKIISCMDCWDICENLKIHYLEIGSACDKKGLRIKPCQLGAF